MSSAVMNIFFFRFVKIVEKKIIHKNSLPTPLTSFIYNTYFIQIQKFTPNIKKNTDLLNQTNFIQLISSRQDDHSFYCLAIYTLPLLRLKK